MKKFLTALIAVLLTSSIAANAAESRIQNWVNDLISPITTKEKELNSQAEAQRKAREKKQKAYEKQQKERQRAYEKKQRERQRELRKQQREREKALQAHIFAAVLRRRVHSAAGRGARSDAQLFQRHLCAGADGLHRARGRRLALHH